uniref:Uncharacterized protein n=1 Tax=Plectus sambesii TaxID=2011161 RepID=A0A914WML2_9BILA
MAVTLFRLTFQNIKQKKNEELVTAILEKEKTNCLLIDQSYNDANSVVSISQVGGPKCGGGNGGDSQQNDNDDLYG